MRALHDMLQQIGATVAADPPRGAAAERGREVAGQLAQRFPLVHRAVKSGGVTLAQIFASGHLLAGSPCTERERRCGIERSLYFFFGCGAFPEGAVAFLVRPTVLAAFPATYFPFDTGSLERHARPRDLAHSWEDGDKQAFLTEHLGTGCDAAEFAVEYIATHFASPPDYVLRPQHSEPDFPTYHGLASLSGDRRAWSIEVQLHDHLPLASKHIEAIVLGQSDLLADIPDDLVETVVIAEAEGAITTEIHRYIVPAEAA